MSKVRGCFKLTHELLAHLLQLPEDAEIMWVESNKKNEIIEVTVMVTADSADPVKGLYLVAESAEIAETILRR